MSTKKVVLITGATSGIGKELAKCFAMNSYEVIIVARDTKKLKQTAEEFQKRYGTDVTTLAVDLSEINAVDTIMTALGSRGIDILVNNAGFAVHGLFAESDDEQTMSSIRLNVEALTELTHRLLPQMIDRRSGKILNVASTAAFQPGPLMSVYYATKAYVLSFSEGLRYELKGTGVTVTTLCPGPTKTEFGKRAGMTKSNLFKLGTMEADTVARIGYQGLMEGKAIIVPGLKNKLGMVLAKFSPRMLVVKTIYKLNSIKK